MAVAAVHWVPAKSAVVWATAVAQAEVVACAAVVRWEAVRAVVAIPAATRAATRAAARVATRWRYTNHPLTR